MLELMANDLAASSSVTEGIVRWCPNNAFSQALENKPEYVDRIRQMGLDILLVRGSTQTYYTLSQSQSQNTGNSTVSHMAERIRELEAELDLLSAQNEARSLLSDGNSTGLILPKLAFGRMKPAFRGLRPCYYMGVPPHPSPKWPNVGLTQKEANMLFVLFLFFLLLTRL
jgi:hypothetical protein